MGRQAGDKSVRLGAFYPQSPRGARPGEREGGTLRGCRGNEHQTVGMAAIRPGKSGGHGEIFSHDPFLGSLSARDEGGGKIPRKQWKVLMFCLEVTDSVIYLFYCCITPRLDLTLQRSVRSRTCLGLGQSNEKT